MYHWGSGFGVAAWIMIGLTIALLGALLVVVIVWLARSRQEGPGGYETARGRHPHAQEILDERYARGEISDEEYRVRSAALRRT